MMIKGSIKPTDTRYHQTPNTTNTTAITNTNYINAASLFTMQWSNHH